VNTPAYRFGFIGFLIVFLAAALFRGQKALLIDWGMAKPMLIAWTTTVLLYVAGRMGKLTTWLRFAPLQYLGKISYSLYLSHMLVSGYVLRLGFRLTHHDPASAVFWFFTAGAISLVAAHGLYLLIEQRSVKFAARFKLRDDDAAANGGTGLPRLPKLQNA
jgi:peptidoglycan/LPS O-acetylase OafA/YrhL